MKNLLDLLIEARIPQVRSRPQYQRDLRLAFTEKFCHVVKWFLPSVSAQMWNQWGAIIC